MKKGILLRVFTFSLLVLCILLSFGFHNNPPLKAVPEKTDILFNNLLDSAARDIAALNKSCAEKAGNNDLQWRFRQARISFKKLAVLLAYFQPAEYKWLNNPNLPRVEAAPDQVIQPTGYQVIEELLFSEAAKPDYEAISRQAAFILEKLEEIKKEKDRSLKYKPERVFDALVTAINFQVTLDITGFDSPVAQHALPEAAATLEGIGQVLALFDGAGSKTEKNFSLLKASLKKANDFLLAAQSFNQFDRLSYITACYQPLALQLASLRKQLGLELKGFRKPVLAEQVSLFEKEVFNLRFFSPPAPYEMSAEKIRLGRQLFNDPVLSGTGTKSCASCHIPEKAFADGLKFSAGIDNVTPLTRNTPSLWYTAFQTRFFYDSKADFLENQLDDVVHNSSEMKGSLNKSAQLIRRDSQYVQLFNLAYPEEKTPIVEYNIANAISSYIRSLTGMNARFDNYIRGDAAALTAAEKKGFNLFAGKAKCATCHFIPLFNGLRPPDFTDTESEVVGVPDRAGKKKILLDPDEGKKNFTTSVIHRFAFKTPTLRNIALTAPYMHNGVYNTLDEVLDFYNNGGGKGRGIAPPNQTLPFSRLHLSRREKKEIIAFMKALTDTVSFRQH